ncbi:MAG: DUF1801 domain-containing protein [Leptospiraceae bacterium]|nr:DUF1801 domain-containing protein [Leptospiraceae bacterium]
MKTTANPKIDAWLDRAVQWQVEMRALRKILLQLPLQEELKWAKPCYTANGKNIVIMQPFKQQLALLFFQGSRLSDPAGVLCEQGPNSRLARRLEFTSVAGIEKLKPLVQNYV